MRKTRPHNHRVKHHQRVNLNHSPKRSRLPVQRPLRGQLRGVAVLRGMRRLLRRVGRRS